MKQRRWMVLGVFLAGSAISLAQTLDSSTRATIDGVIDQLKTNYLFAKNFDWETLRKQTLEAARKTPNGQEPRAAITGLLETINDPAIVFSEWLTQEQVARRREVGGIGILANAETGVIYEVFIGGAGEKAGLHVGDKIITVNNKPAKIQAAHVFSSGKTVPMVVERNGQNLEINVALSTISEELAEKITPMRAGRLGRVAYIEPDRTYMEQEATRIRLATGLQYNLRTLENSGACGYIVDFRRGAGDFAVSLSGFGPLLTTTDQPLLKINRLEQGVFSFLYEPSSGNAKRDLSIIASLGTRPWKPQRPDAPVAVLTSPFDGWALPILFVGRKNVRFFGEQQLYPPFWYSSVSFKDGAYIDFPSGYVLDRLGYQYDAPFEVDETIPTDWATFGSKNDVVIQAAQAWLESQPACR